MDGPSVVSPHSKNAAHPWAAFVRGSSTSVLRPIQGYVGQTVLSLPSTGSIQARPDQSHFHGLLAVDARRRSAYRYIRYRCQTVPPQLLTPTGQYGVALNRR